MKIGIQVKITDRCNYEHYEKLKQLGYCCIDLDLSNTEIFPYDCSETELQEWICREKTAIEEAGMEVSQVHGPWRWPPRDDTEENRAERMEKMKKSLRITALLGCKNWVVHPIMPFGVDDIELNKQEETWDFNMHFMRELLQVAKEYGIVICLENMPMLKFSLARPREILRFVQTINDDNFQICLDTGHVNVFRELDITEEIRLLDKYIRVLHVHDNNGGYDGHFMPFYGNIDWRAFKNALDEIGFEGVFSLETLPSERLPSAIAENVYKILFDIANDIINPEEQYIDQ